MARSTQETLLKGAALNWIKIALAILIQLAATSVYLHYWPPAQLGAWLALQAFVAVWRIPGIAHQDYVGNELLRFHSLHTSQFSKVLSSALGMGVVYGACELLAAVVLALVAPHALGLATGQAWPASDIQIAFIVLILGQGTLWNWGGIWTRAAIARGHYVTSAWLNVIEVVLTPLGPLFVLPWGTGLVGVAVALMVGTVPVHLFSIFVLRKRAVCALAAAVCPDWRLAIRQFGRAQGLSFIALVAQLRQQGVRLVLAPLSGAASVAAFSTLRTGANLALQGLATITSPLLPDLMRFLVGKDQARSEAALGIVWLVLVAGIAPSVVLVQAGVEPLFASWTHGKIPFDPWLFAMLSLGVVVYAVTQPSYAIVAGNNLVAPQILLAAAAGFVAIGGMFIFVPRWGIVAAGASLLAAEVVAAVGYQVVARRWMASIGLVWPRRLAGIAALSVVTTTVALLLQAWLPDRRWIILLFAYLALAACSWAFWRNLPLIARASAQANLARWPVTRRLFSTL